MTRPTADPIASPWAAPDRGGVRVRVRAVPGARREGVLGVHGDALRVAVRAPAEAGRANDALLSLLAGELGVARRDLELLSGRSGRDKVLVVTGLDQEAVVARIGRILRGHGVATGEDRGR